MAVPKTNNPRKSLMRTDSETCQQDILTSELEYRFIAIWMSVFSHEIRDGVSSWTMGNFSSSAILPFKFLSGLTTSVLMPKSSSRDILPLPCRRIHRLCQSRGQTRKCLKISLWRQLLWKRFASLATHLSIAASVAGRSASSGFFSSRSHTSHEVHIGKSSGMPLHV